MAACPAAGQPAALLNPTPGVHAFEVEEALADAREELDAVREINRELLTQCNRPAR